MVLHIGGDAFVRLGDIIAITGRPDASQTTVIAWDHGTVRRYPSELSLRTLGRRTKAPYGDAVYWKKHAR